MKRFSGLDHYRILDHFSWEGHLHVIMESSNCEAVCQSQARKVATVKEPEPRGILLDAGEFERMLRRAAEVLKVRQRAA